MLLREGARPQQRLSASHIAGSHHSRQMGQGERPSHRHVGTVVGIVARQARALTNDFLVRFPSRYWRKRVQGKPIAEFIMILSGAIEFEDAGMYRLDVTMLLLLSLHGDDEHRMI